MPGYAVRSDRAGGVSQLTHAKLPAFLTLNNHSPRADSMRPCHIAQRDALSIDYPLARKGCSLHTLEPAPVATTRE